jgi:hypothetical protein
MVAGISLVRQYVRAGFVLADLNDHPSRAAGLASEASVAGGADRDRTEPVPGESPIDRIRAILHEARNHFPELGAADVCFRAGARGERFFLCLVRISTRPPWYPRQGAGGRSHGRPAAPG